MAAKTEGTKDKQIQDLKAQIAALEKRLDEIRDGGDNKLILALSNRLVELEKKLSAKEVELPPVAAKPATPRLAKKESSSSSPTQPAPEPSPAPPTEKKDEAEWW